MCVHGGGGGGGGEKRCKIKVLVKNLSWEGYGYFLKQHIVISKKYVSAIILFFT